ncbi:aldo/keto reductase [Sphingomonas sp. MA1305]|uniref:aldo/keto reductase n=1 Tax=Sphingomonas sp. MA1305 TaxID=2479204 RepID=UPI0018DFC376|nr:aldo/keto reductase [Sphingomonas sp. MA1305]MBI0475378.1 aldo/keto reductase [Sphingomonas sp. MA1305]
MTDIALSSAPRPLGRSGMLVSPIAWGMWRLAGDDTKAVRAAIDAALGAGITLFDTADIYGADQPAGFGSAEILFGRALAEAPALRDTMTIATKGGIRPGIPYNSSATYLAEALDASLARMGIDQVDLYQIHRRDLLAHPQEVAAALDAMVASGKVRSIGVSNHSAAELDALQAFLGQPIVSTQPEFSALHSVPLFDGTLDQAMARDIAVLAWSPLGGGRLADATLPAAALLADHGTRFGVDAATAALAWVMAHPARVIPIVGSQQPARIAAAAGAYAVRWTRAEWYAVLQAGMGQALP